MENSIGLPGLEVGADGSATFIGGDIGLEGYTARNCFYRCEIDSNNEGIGGHDLCGDLTP